MVHTWTASNPAERIAEFARRDFHPHFGELTEQFDSNPTWRRLGELGTELWLDTGDIDSAMANWTREFTALTTNNTLLNREVQKGTYDAMIPEVSRLLDHWPELTCQRRKLEMDFALNAMHGLKLVERFDAFVSVEEHTALANDLPASIEYARRYHAICPERFIVKIPFTPAGLLATRRLSAEGIAVNCTLGFSARQNYLAARIGRPMFVNVFLGRLNSFIADNHLGDGLYIGQRATIASQAAIRQLQDEHNSPTRQIGASFRAGTQIDDLVGIDVMTMPPKVAREFLDLDLPLDDINDCTSMEYPVLLDDEVSPESIRLDTLWNIEDELVACIDDLEQQDLADFTPDDLVRFFAERGCGDVLIDWTAQEIATSRAEGKIPKIDNWRDQLESGRIGLDSLMNLAGFNSFAADQNAMDERIHEVLKTV